MVGRHVAIPLRGFLFATSYSPYPIAYRLSLVLQSPYGAFCLRPARVVLGPGRSRPGVAIPLRGFLFATGWMKIARETACHVGCNPLTGLFVCDRRAATCGSRGASAMSCNPLTGLFVCDKFSRCPLDGPYEYCCNPLTGLFVCDWLKTLDKVTYHK